MPAVLSESNKTNAPTGQFKARPVNKKIMESAGDLGVPRVAKKAPTVPREFNLTSRPTSARTKKPEPEEKAEKPIYSSFGRCHPPPPPKPFRQAAAPVKKQTPRGPAPAPVPVPVKASAPAPAETKIITSPVPSKALAPVAPVEIKAAPEEPVDVSEPVDSVAAEAAALEKLRMETYGPILERLRGVAVEEESDDSDDDEVPILEQNMVEEKEEAAASGAKLTVAMLQALQAEHFADDVPIEPSMVHWSLEQAKAFFESGGDVRPPVVEEAPASPERPLIKAEDLATPQTEEF